MSNQTSAKERLLAQARLDYQPDLVAVDAEAIARLPVRADRFSHATTGLSEKPAGQTHQAAAAYSIALNSINFMFWTPTPEGMARYDWNGAGGADGLTAALDHVWGAQPAPDRLREVLGSGEEKTVIDAFGDISMPRRRAHFLREVLRDDQLEQAAAELVAAGDTGRLTSDDAERLAKRFPVAYGQDTYLMRAQLAVMWYAGYLIDQGTEIDCDVIVAANYQMPRVMRSIKVLRYSPELAAKIDRHTLIVRHSVEERAIRAATVLSTQAMAQHLGVSEHAMVNVLWKNRLACGNVPHHLTITTDY
ncbi:queuosine salvage family protein [Noviherbaspirillum denitrificans]|uniref:Queuosine 5'-phosphate N-glycosylase/hydrolase n=1 Tax=Noviherbaspirillum denitrificans TaxID=1968433 RepID=A0A254TH33_9BURK|nr:queuosine salvage family protein [Noviherbaspirillum denitrificans]OWW21950.1 hypothetical protein AYR66_23110 [Noviherbaspirillum denitrificans]